MKYDNIGILALPERDENDINTGWLLCIKYADFRLWGYNWTLMWREKYGIKEPASKKSVEILNSKTGLTRPKDNSEKLYVLKY
jgi:hypothetical protein